MELQTKGGGLTITKVLPNTPAAKAKLLPNDVITEVNGVSIPQGASHDRAVRCGRRRKDATPASFSVSAASSFVSSLT